MELPHLGKNCTENTCNKLDFLPIKCDACNEIYCDEHYHYMTHNCPNAYKKNNQVPVCPLCNTPIPIPKGQQPDVVVGKHIDNYCESDKAKNRRQIFVNRCSLKGCKGKEVIPVVCNECTLNYCLKHRHPTDHQCEGKLTAQRSKLLNAALSRERVTNQSENISHIIQGNMSEDEALAAAMALSMQDTKVTTNKKRQEELDYALAKQLQAGEQTTVGGERNTRERCNIS